MLAGSEWIHRITSHIPDPGRHCQRFYGAYSDRTRIPAFPTDAKSAGLSAAKPPEQNGFLQGSPQYAGSPDKENLRGGLPSCAVAGRACASSPLLQIPARLTVSCAILKAHARKRRIPSNQGRRPLPQQRFGNEAADTADARLRTGRPFGRGVSKRRQNLSRQARNSGLAGI
jgi:hypothetical protein